MDSSALLKPNVTQELISVLMRSMLFAAYANIIELRDDSVVVQGSICDNLTPFTTTVKLIYPTTKFVQMTFKPEVGDKVLVIGLQSYSDKMFSADKLIRDIPENNVQHYTILGCVAIPLNIESVKAPIKISNDATAITLGRGAVPGEDPVVRWSELNTALQGLVEALNEHTHSGSGSGTPTAPFALDISSAASDILKVPAAGE